jgi:hypothetical protein
MIVSILASFFCGASVKRQAANHHDTDTEKVANDSFVHRSSRLKWFHFEAKVHSIDTLIDYSPYRGGRLGAERRFETHSSSRKDNTLRNVPDRWDKLARSKKPGASKNLSLLPDSSVTDWAERRIGCGGLGELEVL